MSEAMKSPSPLAAALTQIFGRGARFNVTQVTPEQVLDGEKLWAVRLGVAHEVLRGWKADESLPRSSDLREILTSVKFMWGEDSPRFLELVRVMDMPAHEATPHYAQVLGTLGTYSLQGLREGLERVLSTLPTLRQEEVIYAAADLARLKRREISAAETTRAMKVAEAIENAEAGRE